MIQNSFVFLQGVSKAGEKKLYSQGIRNWEDFLACGCVKGISPARKLSLDRQLRQAHEQLYTMNSAFFTHVLPRTEHWRLYDFFKEDTVFLDIETNGLSKYHNDVTVVGLFDGTATKQMIRGINLDWKALAEELARYKLIVTFNGASFDLPFLKHKYPPLNTDVPHLDLRHAFRQLGHTGGLKAIEQKLGFVRPDIVKDMTGGDALTLWRMYRATGDEHYLNLLVQYNEEDIINLRPLAEYAYENLSKKCLCEAHSSL